MFDIANLKGSSTFYFIYLLFNWFQNEGIQILWFMLCFDNLLLFRYVVDIVKSPKYYFAEQNSNCNVYTAMQLSKEVQVSPTKSQVETKKGTYLGAVSLKTSTSWLDAISLLLPRWEYLSMLYRYNILKVFRWGLMRILTKIVSSWKHDNVLQWQ